MTAASWSDESLFVTVNVSGSQLRGASIVEHVRRALDESGLAASRLVLEITESMLIDDPEGVAGELVGLRTMGVRIALDDFGTGYSSLAYVQRLPLDIIKIDREFVQSLGKRSDDALTRTIVTMAHNLGLETIGEGVEEESQVIGLAQIGCDYTQGFLVSEPLSASSMAAMLDDLAARERGRATIEFVIAVDAAPDPIALVSDPLVAATEPVAQTPSVAPAQASPPATLAPVRASADRHDRSELPRARRLTGRDEELARLLRPLINSGDGDHRSSVEG